MPSSWSTTPYRTRQALTAAVMARDGYTCRVPTEHGYPCGAPATCTDHVVPVALGGLTELTNLRAACSPCNLRKGARPDAAPLRAWSP